MSYIFVPFDYLFNYTLGYLFKGFFYLLKLILPTSAETVIVKYGTMFIDGIRTTLNISLFGTIIGLLIAILFASIRTITIKKTDSKAKKGIFFVIHKIIDLYVIVFRGTPMMVQAMIIYYGLVGIFNFTPITAGLIIVSINTGAYLTEVMKKGITSVDYGQKEAAYSLGLSGFQTFIHITLPQAIKTQMASIGNEFVINIKDTSVLNVIGCAEMFFVLKTSAASDYHYLETMLVGALIYLILTLSVTKILSIIDKKIGSPKVEILSSN